jgi:hypothetical protein
MNTDPTFIQLLNSYFVQSVSLMDGVMPARYGYLTSGVIDIRTKDGCDGGKNNATIMSGQRDNAQGNFQIAGCDGNLGYYLTGTFLQSNLGFSSAVPAPDPIHDAVTQGQGFAYLTYALGPTTKLSLISGMTLAFNQFPNQPNLPPQYQLDHISPASYPSSGINSGLNQPDYYGVLALNGVLGSNWDYQLAYSAHYNTQSFYPVRSASSSIRVSPRTFSRAIFRTLEGESYVPSRPALAAGRILPRRIRSRVRPEFTGVPNHWGQPATRPISVIANLNKINLVYGSTSKTPGKSQTG